MTKRISDTLLPSILLILAALILALPAVASAQDNAGGDQYAPSEPTPTGPEKPSKISPAKDPTGGGGGGGPTISSPSVASPVIEQLNEADAAAVAPPTEKASIQTASVDLTAEQLAAREARQEAKRRRAAKRERERRAGEAERLASERQQEAAEAAIAARVSTVGPTAGEGRIGTVFPLLMAAALAGALALIVRRRRVALASEADATPNNS